MNIDQRIATAFGNKVTSAEVVALITDVELALIEAGEASNLARAQALSPLLSMDEVAPARRLWEESQNRQSRLEYAIPKLRERLAWLRAQEEDAKRQVVYDRVEAERDKLAKELADTYPELASKLAELLSRVTANDAEIARVNTKLPSDRSKLLGAELVARGPQVGTPSIPSIVRDTHLPDFTHDPEPYLWPSPRRFIYD